MTPRVLPSVRPRRLIVVAMWWMLGALVYFRRSFFTGFDKVMGDDGDGRLIVYIHEHWLRVFRGNAS